jgi:hypothetical protein
VGQISGVTNRQARDWKLAEKVAALFEKSLSPDASVTCNEILHDLITGHPRQCDVVIRSGTHQRTTTIVEVQDRADKVDRNMYGGWLDKMRCVGAQNLICVSVEGFPQSIVDDVRMRQGDSVRLLTLQALEQVAWPFQSVRGAVRRVHMHIADVGIETPLAELLVTYGPTRRVVHNGPSLGLGNSTSRITRT